MASELEERSIREIERRAEKPVRALRLGIVLIFSSFILGYPIVAGALYLYGPEVGFYCYAASWFPLLLGVLVGGRPAYRAVKYYRHRMRRRFLRAAGLGTKRGPL